MKGLIRRGTWVQQPLEKVSERLARLSDDMADLNIKTECKTVIKTQLCLTQLKSQLETSEAWRRQMPR